MSAPSVLAYGSIIIPTLAVIVNPSSLQMAAGTTAQFTANVSYPGPGVTWSIQCSAADCGSIAPSTSASGAAVTYTAPAAVPAAGMTVNIQAASIANPGIAAVATVNLGGDSDVIGEAIRTSSEKSFTRSSLSASFVLRGSGFRAVVPPSTLPQ